MEIIKTDIKEIIDEITEKIIQYSPNDFPTTLLARFVKEAILNTIPCSVITTRPKLFLHSYFKNKKPFLEISLFTSDNFIYDFTITNESKIIASMKLSQDTTIQLTEYFQASENNSTANINIGPYKVNLLISKGTTSMKYEAEGDRRVIFDLKNYGQELFQANHLVIQKGKK